VVWKHISEAGEEALQYIEDRRDGKERSLRTKWNKFNDVLLDGVEWNNIITFAGMSSSGKTLVLSELESDLVDRNPHTDFAILSNNFEMLSRNLVLRKLSSKLGVTYKHLLSADGEKLESGLLAIGRDYVRESLAKYPIYYVDFARSVKELEQIIIDFYEVHRIPIICSLDHTILMKKAIGQSTQDMLYALGEMQSRLKKQLTITFINISQLNRDIEDKERREPGNILNYPVKSDIFGADAIFQHSDVVVINHRPSLLYLNIYGPERLVVEPNDIYWHCLKVRNGEPQILKMRANFKHMSIEEV